MGTRRARDGGDDDSSGDGDADGSPWDWCPGSGAFIGDEEWTDELTVNDTTYCGAGMGSLEDVFRGNTQMYIAPESYPFPNPADDYDFRLPLCFRVLDETIGSSLGEPGTLTISAQTSWRESQSTQAVTIGEKDWTFSWDQIIYNIGGFPEPELGAPQYNPDVETTLSICEGDCIETTDFRSFYPCQEGEVDNAALVSFSGGELQLHVIIQPGQIGPSVPAQLTRAIGSLDGGDFDQADFFKLAHLPDHHNNGGQFIVIFDELIGEACGLKVTVPSADGSFNNLELKVWTLDCDLNVLEERADVAVTS